MFTSFTINTNRSISCCEINKSKNKKNSWFSYETQ